MTRKWHLSKRVYLLLETADLWVGFFWCRKTRRLFFLPLPCLGIVFDFAQKIFKPRIRSVLVIGSTHHSATFYANNSQGMDCTPLVVFGATVCMRRAEFSGVVFADPGVTSIPGYRAWAEMNLLTRGFSHQELGL